MELAWITVEKIVEMFFIMLLGAAAYHYGVVDSAANKRISGICLKIVSPAMIFMSYQIEFQQELLRGLAITAACSALSMVLAIGVTKLMIRTGKSLDVEIEKISVIYSNCGFIGIPLIHGLLGREGVFYMTAYITVFNLLIWSHGLALMCGTGSLKATLQKFVQPATIAIGAGIVCFLLRIRLPEVIGNPLGMIGDMNTPLAMLVAGCNLAESNLLAAFRRPRTYYVSFLKLLLIPFLTALLLGVVGAGQTIALTILVATACPSAAMGTMFALQYQRDSNYAAELFAITTVLSLVTIPAVILMSAGIVL